MVEHFYFRTQSADSCQILFVQRGDLVQIVKMEIRPKVIISGFEPFGIHKINASWESVKNISKKELEKDFNVELMTVEIPVIYDKVDQIVPNLWKENNPLVN